MSLISSTFFFKIEGVSLGFRRKRLQTRSAEQILASMERKCLDTVGKRNDDSKVQVVKFRKKKNPLTFKSSYVLPSVLSLNVRITVGKERL